MIIDKLTEYLKECPLFDELFELNVDYLGYGVNNISIEPTPTETIVKTFIDGSTERQYLFIIGTRFNYSEESAITIDNSGFFERFQNWLEKQTKDKTLPVLDTGQEVISIEALSSGYLVDINSDMRDARYQIQCVLRYMQEEEYNG